MAAFKVEITSREMINPFTPTPPHLKTHQLSFIDQMAPPVHMSFIFFYPNNSTHPFHHNNQNTSTLLKTSLSNALAHFYPLAGRLEGNKSINCSDEGVVYNEAYVSTHLSQVIENPNIDDLTKLLPFGPIDRKNVVFGTQMTRFSCGGMAISVCLTHKIGDGTAFIDFVHSWAAITRATLVGKTFDPIKFEVVQPKFDGASHFPPRDLTGIYSPEVDVYKEKIVRRRFVFDKQMLDVLKNQALGESSSQMVKPPTRVEAVSAFIWKCVMEASRVKPTPKTTNFPAALHAVDLRTRMSPQIPNNSFGNYWWFAIASSLTGPDAKHPELVANLRESIANIQTDFIKTLQNGQFFLGLKKAIETSTLQVPETCNFTSASRFPLYEVDFGWGKPIWVGPPIFPTKNLALLLPTKCGEGIELWVNMIDEKVVALLERDYRLLPTSKSVADKELSFGYTTSSPAPAPTFSSGIFRSQATSSLTTLQRRTASRSFPPAATEVPGVTSPVGFSPRMSPLQMRRFLSITRWIK